MARRKNDEWICTFTGRQFWPLDPSTADIDLRDISHALANKCRFTGHTREFYSVAQHSVIMADVALKHCDTDTAKWALLHDAAEAYLPDVCRPIKRRVWFCDYAHTYPFCVAENRILTCVAEAFGLPWPWPEAVREEIKRLDLRLLATERRDLIRRPENIPWTVGYDEETQPLHRAIRPWSNREAKLRFERRFCDLFVLEKYA